MEPENLHDEKFHTARVYGKKHLRFLSCFQVLQRKRDEDGGKGTRRETHVLCADDPIRSFPEPASPDHQTMDMLCARIDAYGIQRSIRAAALAQSDTRPPTRAQHRPRPIPRYPCPQTTVHAPLHGATHPDRVRVPARRGKSRLLPVPEHERTGHRLTFHLATPGRDRSAAATASARAAGTQVVRTTGVLQE